MEKYIQKTIIAVLKGEDYREYVLATINDRFLEMANRLTSLVFDYKIKGGNWIDNLLKDMFDEKGNQSKFQLLWFLGLNNKTIRNIAGGTSKNVILELGKKNIETFKKLFDETGGSLRKSEVRITIKKDEKEVVLDPIESAIYLNMIASMKLSIQGGVWSEVGKQTEKGLLYTIFKLLNIDDDYYVLDDKEMKERNLVSDRQIDGIVYGSGKNPLYIEVKLLGIGNPEIGDEALAREVDLFLTDQLSDKMVILTGKKGVKVILFRKYSNGKVLNEIYDFFKKAGVKCDPPPKLTWVEMETKIKTILNDFNIENE
jgi:hypothetical protein